MILRHYSAEPLMLDAARTYEPDRFNFKPSGLWLSVVGDSDWEEWCRAESFSLESLAYHQDFELLQGSGVLQISDPDDLRRFTRRYQRVTSLTRLERIDWRRVAADHRGVLIAPYQWECRLECDMLWYYTWDCASACVWDLSVIRLVNQEVSA